MSLEIIRTLPGGRIEFSCGCMIETAVLEGDPTLLVHACKASPPCELRAYVEDQGRRMGHRIEHRSHL